MHGGRTALAGLATGVAIIWSLPTLGHTEDRQPLRDVAVQLDASVREVTAPVREEADAAARRLQAAAAPATQAPSRGTAVGQSAAEGRAETPTPRTDPPLHGTNPHGQGTVSVIDITPSSERPLGGSPDGADAGPEEVVVGRARGEQGTDGNYRGHITIAALFGREVVGVDSTEGQTSNGPLEPLQAGALDALCDGSGQQICLSLLTADSTTTSSGSTNDFAVARAQLGGPQGIGVGAAESQGSISEEGSCQTSTGSARTANVSAGGGAVANVANSSSTSRSCRGESPQVTNSSQVIGLGGTGVPLPAAGCADGTPDTETGIPTLLPIVCNADTIAGAAGVREALDVFVLDVGGTTLLKESTAASESVSQSPAEATRAACSDGVDNDGDGRVDAADPGCHTDGDANNPATFDPNDTSEADAGGPTTGSGDRGRPQCSDGRDNDGDGVSDRQDPGCHTDGNANNASSFDPEDDSEADGRRRPVGGSGDGGRPQCSDGRDNDGDGVSDRRDPGCHTDGNADNPASYDPNDDAEADRAATQAAGTLPFTGTDIVGLLLAALLALAGGLVLRWRDLAASR